MKALTKLFLLAMPLFVLSACHVRVDDGHRHHRHHHDEVIIEKR